MAEPNAVVEAHIRRSRSELIEAGFRPARLSFPVRLLRRLVWPFVRPFHFHTLDRLAAADLAIARLETEISRLSGRTVDPARLHVLEVRIDRAEALEARVERAEALEARVERAEALEARVHRAETRMDKAEARMDAAAGDIERLDKTGRASASEVARLEALEAGIHALRDARRPAREQEVARLDRIEIRLDGLENWADGHRRHVELMQTSRSDDVTRMVALHSRLRSDLLAIGNRHVWVEERTAAALQVVEQLRDQAQALREDLFLAATQDGVFLLKVGELISESARRDGSWDAHIVRIAAQAHDVVRGRNAAPTALLGIDVGAHFGLISVALARLFDRVISFEPNTFNAALLRANVLLNGLDGTVDVRRQALAAAESTLSLAPSERQEIPLPLDEQGRFAPGAASNLGAYSFVADGTGLSRTEAIPLDRLGLEGVAFIKIDAQGADGTVLLGAMDTIARCRPWLVFEWEQLLAQAFSVSFDEIDTQLAALGYRISVLHRHNTKQIDYLAVPQEEADLVPEGAAG